MKRKASHVIGSDSPAKLKKETTNKTVEKTLSSLKKEKSAAKPVLQPVKLSSFSPRQRKAPSWLASYVTNSAQEKEVKSEKVKPKLPRFPTLIPPSKQKKVAAEKSNGIKDEETPALLRRQSTLKLESPTSPGPKASSKSISKKTVKPRASLTRKSTEILNLSEESSNEDYLSKKYTVSPSAVKKISVLSKGPKKVNVAARLSDSKTTVKKTSSIPKRVEDVKGSQNCSSNVIEICDSKPFSNHVANDSSFKWLPSNASKPKPNSSICPPPTHNAFNMQSANTLLLPEQNRPNMLEVVICISTSGALRDYLAVIQARIREMIWRLQSLIPNLRIGVMAHTQGGIHDDQTRTGFGSGDHNYNRVGGHSGTKWLDLGATLSQICAFVDSLEPEPTVYPDYVQDNLEMALWKLQRCMSWSSCSYRTVIMIGRGRPNRTSFYLQKEHWRSWIRTALELRPNMDIPIIDWELEAKLLAQMAIHVFTIQGAVDSVMPAEEDEGTCFFRRVAELTQGQHFRVSDPSRLVEIILGVCCACHGPDLLSDHRETVRDDNDGLLPSQLTGLFVSLQLHSKSRSLASLPTLMGNLDIASMRERLTNSQQTIMKCSDEEEEPMEAEAVRYSLPMEMSSETEKPSAPRSKENGSGAIFKAQKQDRREKEEGRRAIVKRGRVTKNPVVSSNRTNKKIKQAVQTVTKGKAISSSTKNNSDRRNKGKSPVRGRGRPPKSNSMTQIREKGKSQKETEKPRSQKRKALDSSKETKKSKCTAVPPKKKTPTSRPSSKCIDPKSSQSKGNSAVLKAKAALKLKAAKTKLTTGKRGRPRSTPKEQTPKKGKLKDSTAKVGRGSKQKTPQRNGPVNARKSGNQSREKKTALVRNNSRRVPASKKSVKELTKRRPYNKR